MKKENIVQLIEQAADYFSKAHYTEALSNVNTILSFLHTYFPDGSLTGGSIKEDEEYIIYVYVQTYIIEGNIEYRRGNFDSSLRCFNSAIKYAEESNDISLMARALGNIGNVYISSCEYEKALEYYFKSLTLLTDTDRKADYANVLGNIGSVYIYRSEFAEGLKYLKKSLQIHEDLGSVYETARTVANIGILYFNIEDFAHALEYLEKSLTIFDFSQGDHIYPIICSNLASTYLNLGNVDEALKYYEKALNFSEQMDQKADLATVLGNIGYAYSKKGDCDKAIDCFKRGAKISEMIGDTAGIGFNLSHMGVVQSNSDFSVYNPELAEQNIKKALELFESIGNKREVYECHKDLSSLFKTIGRWSDFAYHLEKFYEIKQDVMNTSMKKDAEQFLRDKENEYKQRENTILHEKNQILEEANIFKTKLLGIAAHDLKNPLGNIIGATHVVMSEIGDNISAKEWLEVIEDSAKRMNQLILELLESSAATLGVMELKKSPCSIGEVLERVMRQLEPMLHKKAQAIEKEAYEDCEIYADENKLFQVFENLMSNASKYSYYGTKIYLSVKKGDRIVRFSVRDEGQGMTSDDLEKLFGQFQRLSATPTGGENSTGLGLNIVKHIVELHRGKIWAESEGQGFGTTFFVELPL